MESGCGHSALTIVGAAFGRPCKHPCFHYVADGQRPPLQINSSSFADEYKNPIHIGVVVRHIKSNCDGRSILTYLKTFCEI